MLTVIGIGNPLRGDDGVGPAVIHYLQKNADLKLLRLYDAGSDMFVLLDHLLQSEPLIVIDCAQMGNAPGTIRMVSIDESDYIDKKPDVSLHGIGLIEMWQLARSLGDTVGFCVIGIEPKKIEFNSDLSAEVRKSIPAVARMVMKEAKKYAKKDTDH